MYNTKLLIAISKNLANTLTNINNLDDCINKYCWQEIVENLLQDISKAIEFEKTLNK